LTRIVSLLASGTEIVAALGLGERLVGISHECDFPPPLLDRPRVSRSRFDPAGLTSAEIDQAVRDAMAEHGSVYEIDGDLLEALRPEVILTQAVCEVCAVPTSGVEAVVAARELAADVVSLDAHTIDEILASIAKVGAATASSEIADDTIAGIRARLDRVASAVADASRPRVLAIEWLDPPFTPGHWVPEMVEAAGGKNLVGETGLPSRQVEWASISDLDPDVLVVMPCGFGVDAAAVDARAHAARLTAVAPRAIAEERAFVVDASAYFNRSGPRFVAGVEILAGLLHPDRFDPPGDDRAAPMGGA